jgi:hypothetical protein
MKLRAQEEIMGKIKKTGKVGIQLKFVRTKIKTLICRV